MIQSIRGTKDIYGDSLNSWYFIEEQIKKVASYFGYSELRTPIFEKTEVFDRTIGDGTDIVNKEMYTFIDKGGESVTLRPEMTAALVRCLVQNNMMAQNSIQKLWYFGPFFRYERPQKGRLRQFHQFGLECLGSQNPESDAEVILFADKLFRNLGINEYNLYINSLGNKYSRHNYINSLTEFLKDNLSVLSAESQLRIEKNPLRVLDSKSPQDKEIMKSAPSILEFLDEESSSHFNSVKQLLTSSGIKFIVNPNLVRGLDYYCHTVFEFQSSHLGSQDSFGGGGRYDGLFEQLGGNPTPAVGFALGVERLIIILEGLKKEIPSNEKVDLFIVTVGAESIEYSLRIATMLRERGLRVYMDLNRRSFKAQMREANKQNSSFTAIIGETEVADGTVIIKNMATSEQKTYRIEELNEFNIW
jgi:histidyl-tRNA synthetase